MARDIASIALDEGLHTETSCIAAAGAGQAEPRAADADQRKSAGVPAHHQRACAARAGPGGVPADRAVPGRRHGRRRPGREP